MDDLGEVCLVLYNGVAIRRCLGSMNIREVEMEAKVETGKNVFMFIKYICSFEKILQLVRGESLMLSEFDDMSELHEWFDRIQSKYDVRHDLICCNPSEAAS